MTAADRYICPLNVKRTEWIRVGIRALTAVVGSMPKFAPLDPTIDEAKEWLADLSELAVRTLDQLPRPVSNIPLSETAVVDVFHEQFGV